MLHGNPWRRLRLRDRIAGAPGGMRFAAPGIRAQTPGNTPRVSQHTVRSSAMSTLSSKIGDVVENADIDRDTDVPEIHVEEKRLSLHDFLKTAVKINGSDIHLQAGSIPMIRVDGRARFLDCPPLTDDALKEYVDQIINRQVEPAEKRGALEHKGAVDVAYPFENVARFR